MAEADGRNGREGSGTAKVVIQAFLVSLVATIFSITGWAVNSFVDVIRKVAIIEYRMDEHHKADANYRAEQKLIDANQTRRIDEFKDRR